VAAIVTIAFPSGGKGYGLWRYRQERQEPVDDEESGDA
jgi:hypothetical protein